MQNKSLSINAISTAAAPAAIGPYSQAVLHNQTVYISGQIPLLPDTMELVGNNIDDQVAQVFLNLSSICEAAGGSLDSVLKFTVYLTNLEHFGAVNAAMETILSTPYPARAAIGVSSLPRGALVEIDAIMAL